MSYCNNLGKTSANYFMGDKKLLLWDRWSSGVLKPSPPRPVRSLYAFCPWDFCCYGTTLLQLFTSSLPCYQQVCHLNPPSDWAGSSDFQRSVGFSPSFLLADSPPSCIGKALNGVYLTHRRSSRNGGKWRHLRKEGGRDRDSAILLSSSK